MALSSSRIREANSQALLLLLLLLLMESMYLYVLYKSAYWLPSRTKSIENKEDDALQYTMRNAMVYTQYEGNETVEWPSGDFFSGVMKTVVCVCALHIIYSSSYSRTMRRLRGAMMCETSRGRRPNIYPLLYNIDCSATKNTDTFLKVRSGYLIFIKTSL